jgi:hypothetical protein
MGEKSGQRALNVYSAVAAPFAARNYSAAVGDALSQLHSISILYDLTPNSQPHEQDNHVMAGADQAAKKQLEQSGLTSQ